MLAFAPRTLTVLACGMLAILPGCHASRKTVKFDPGDSAHYHKVATDIEYPTVEPCSYSTAADAVKPRDLQSAVPTEFWDLPLEEAIRLALQNTDVLRDVGGRLLTAPDAAPTVYDPAIQESDPNFGVEGALSAFDAQLASGLFWRKNDRVFNNPIAGGSTGQQYEYQQDFGSFDTAITKQTATGATFGVRSFTDFDRNNANPANRLFPESWDTLLDFTYRQPLLQGAGTTFNRIAGPNAQPGFNTNSTGVLLARVSTDISLTDFDAAVIEYVTQVERAYWDLYFAYRNLDAAVLARDQALATWQAVKGKYENNLRGGEAHLEARARAQYFQFQDQVQDALNGARPTTAASAVRSPGVYTEERRLRWLLGLPATGSQLIRPLEEPPTAEVAFDWEASVREALVERVELRRQRWQIKRHELMRIAARNFVLPRLDAATLYRVRGFGEKLAGDSNVGDAEQMRFPSAFNNLGTGDYQEWEAGLQLDVPLGFRQGWAGVRQAEAQLTRARAILAEQQKLVVLQLSDAFAETSRAYAAMAANSDRLNAAQQDRLATKAAYDSDQVTVDILLDSQQRLAEAQRLYFGSRANYALALMDLQAAKGTLLAYDGIQLSEGEWPRQAYRDAASIDRRWRPKKLSYAKMKPGPLSRGHFEAELDPGMQPGMQPASGDAEPGGSPEPLPAPGEPINGEVTPAILVYPAAISASGPVEAASSSATPASQTLMQPASVR